MTHEIFKTAPQALLGIASLTTKVTELLVNHIWHFLPALDNDLDSSLAETNGGLQKLAEAPLVSAGEQRLAAAKMLQEANRSLASSGHSGKIAVGMARDIAEFVDKSRKPNPIVRESGMSWRFPFISTTRV